MLFNHGTYKIHRMSIPGDISCINKETELSSVRMTSQSHVGGLGQVHPSFPFPLIHKGLFCVLCETGKSRASARPFSRVLTRRYPVRDTVSGVASSLLSLVFIHAKDDVVCSSLWVFNKALNHVVPFFTFS